MEISFSLPGPPIEVVGQCSWEEMVESHRGTDLCSTSLKGPRRYNWLCITTTPTPRWKN